MAAMIFLVLCLLGTAFAVASLVVERRKLHWLASPRCTGRAWRTAFPGASSDDIRQFDHVVRGAFGIGERYRLRFLPAVKVMALYRAVEPSVLSMGVDAMELETFAAQINAAWHIDLLGQWRDDLTLGDVFSLTQSQGG